MTDDFENMSNDEIATIATDAGAMQAKALAELAKRAAKAGSVGAPPLVPVQLELIDPPPPIDRLTVNFDEKLPGGARRWLELNELETILGCKRDAALNKAKKAGAAMQIGGAGSPWRVDRLRLVRLFRTQFP